MTMTVQNEWPSVNRIFCIGRNFQNHAQELNNTVPEEPVVFMKPASAWVDLRAPLLIPKAFGEVHHELELALLFGNPISRTNESLKDEEIESAIVGVSIGLDLTRRGLQSILKSKGLPWEAAKAFDGSCPIGPWLNYPFKTFKNLTFSLFVNTQHRQQGIAKDMIFTVTEQVRSIVSWCDIKKGDVLMTGTPAGVGALMDGDKIVASLDDKLKIETWVKRL
ncbi:MAG: fumarylacetoacetate hydrolase family protein [Pseudomonadota bacterium]